MAKTMMILRTIFMAYVALLTSLISMSECDSRITGFTTDLIHRDSPQSPSYDPSLSPHQRIVNALKRSLNRAQNLNSKRPKTSLESGIIPASGEYLMTYSVGNPPVPSLGIADTGSDVIWTQCQPCHQCFNQSLPLFRPKLSHTYTKIPCNSTKCSSLQGTYCSGTSKTCLYYSVYGDHSFTYGELATDTFSLGSAKKRVSIPNITFGCGLKNGGTFSGSESGIVGLGGGKASLVRQLGKKAQGKFSYCLVSLSGHHSNSSKLHFGANARVSGKRAVSTPLVRRDPDTFYYLTLEGISVGNKRLQFYTHSLDNDSGHDHQEGNMIIDSGTTLILLPSGLYAKLEKAVKGSIKLKQIRDPSGLLSLCYFTRKDTVKIPEIIIHFKGADLKLNLENIFVRTSDVSLCLAAKATEDDLAIYGNLAQINFLVGYDLQKRTVSFMPTDCGKL